MLRIILIVAFATCLAVPATAHVPLHYERLTGQVHQLTMERLAVMQQMRRAAERGDAMAAIERTADLMELDGRFFNKMTQWVDCIGG